jgi:Peptidase family M28
VTNKTVTVLGWLVVIMMIAGAFCLASRNILPAPEYEISADKDDLVFSGERAYELAARFATRFTYRHSGTANNRESALWTSQQFAALGYETEAEEFSATLYGQSTPLQNVVAVRPGRSKEAIAIAAHLDQARTTVQGADNDASGMGIMLHLAEIFQNIDTRYTLIFIATDAEEYGMLGAKHFNENHPLSGRVKAAISLDNVGRYNAEGMHIAAMGQKSGYTPLWLAVLTQDTAQKIGVWRPTFLDPVTQVMERSILLSFTDQGPFLARGIPAFDFGVTTPSGWPYYHTPEDTVDKISPGTMGQVGLLTEALVRELEQYEDFPQSAEPYLYFDNENDRTYLPGIYLKLIAFALLLPVFWLTILAWNGRRQGGGAFSAQLINVVLNALPLLGGLLFLYLAAAFNLVPRFDYYPAPPKDPALFEVSWAAVGLFLLIIALTTFLVRWLKKKIPRAEAQRRPVALIVLSVLSLLIFYKNPFSLLFILPVLYFWPLISPHTSFFGKLMNLVFFLLGGSILFYFLYLYSFQIFVGWYMTWYFLQMLAFRMIAPHAALAGITAIAAGITLLEEKTCEDISV